MCYLHGMPEEGKYAKCACESCGGHLEYPVEAGGATIDCPHCHFSTKLPRPESAVATKPGIGAATAFIMLLLVGGIGYATWQYHTSAGMDAAASSDSSNSPVAFVRKSGASSNAPPVALPAAAPVVTKWDGMDASPVTLQKAGEGKLVYAVGELTNVTAQQKFGVKVMIDLFDKSGDKVGSATDYTQSIDAGKAWRFRAMVVERGAVKAELKQVTED